MNLFYPNTTTTPHLLSRGSFFSSPLLSFHRTHENYRPKFLLGWSSSSIRAKLDHNGNGKGSSSVRIEKNDDGGGIFEEFEECVEVILIGSRKDAVFDFCSASPFLSPALRFWNIVGFDLQQRFAKQNSTPRIVEGLSARQSSCKAVILVASAAYGSDHTIALNVLGDAISRNGIVVGIILKPFCFEGQRRQDEVNDLVDSLQKHASFCIVLDTDTLLKNDLVTLDEALKTLNNAVLMAMNAISTLISEKHKKVLNTKHNSSKELQLSEFKEIVESFKEARFAFGAGYNVKTSLLRAINECPFLAVDVKDLSGVVICMFASSGAMDTSDENTILHTIRPSIGWNSEIIVSIVHEPSLEPNTILTTLITFGYGGQLPAPKNGLLSSLGLHFPFIFNIFKKQYQQPANSEGDYVSKGLRVSDVADSPAIGDMPDENLLSGTTEDLGVFSEKPLEEGSTDEEVFSSSNFSGQREFAFLEEDSNSSSHDLDAEGPHMFNRELLVRGNLGSGQPTETSKYSASFPEVTTLLDSVSIYKLPIGVKHFEKFVDTPSSSNVKKGAQWRVDDNEKNSPSVSWSGTTNPGVSYASDLKDIVSSSSKRKHTSHSRKQGGLSDRAASMLESERDTQKKWSRLVKMNYRGGIYRGRAQGGLPEGKGHLLLGDGSIYEGMWRYGKRSGLGTFYFSNGDVFQGSWRDDVMHGKGWLYFHTGDRWFVNFWKGKANGEGRFYSRLGDVFFGHFKEGWRHGNFLRINVDGSRCREVWSEGVLISEEQLDPDVEVG